MFAWQEQSVSVLLAAYYAHVLTCNLADLLLILLAHVLVCGPNPDDILFVGLEEV